MMSNPFSPEKREQVKADATEFLKTFAIQYVKSYGMAIFEDIKSQEEPEESRCLLQYRDWNTVPRDVFKGYCFVKWGSGPGTLGNWKKFYLVENLDYNIDIYLTEKDYSKKKKPKRSISIVGYTLKKQAGFWLKGVLDVLATAGLELNDEVKEKLSSISRFAWALTHPWRTIYVFQLHESKSKGCLCFGGGAVEPEDKGSEYAEEREKWLTFMEKAISRGSARDTGTVPGNAFELTCEKMKQKFDRLENWSDDGTEAEMLTSALMEHALSPMKEDILQGMKGPIAIRLVMWYKVKEAVMKIIEAMITPVWGAASSSAKKVGDKITPTIKGGLQGILEKRDEIREKIIGAISEPMSGPVQQMTNKVGPIFGAFEQAVAGAFEKVKSAYQLKVDLTAMPSDTKKIQPYLDAIPRGSAVADDVHSGTESLEDAFKDLGDLEVFGDMDIDELRMSIEDAALNTLDAAMFTLGTKLVAEGNGNAEGLKDSVREGLDNDVEIKQNEKMKEVMRDMLVPVAQLAAAKVTDAALEALNDLIPDVMEDFLNLEGLRDNVVEHSVGGAIDKLVDSKYPMPAKKILNNI